MKLLLDTHAFLWWTSDPSRLSPTALQAFQDAGNEIYLSYASIWEMLIKEQLGKLRLKASVRELVEAEVRVNRIVLLSVALDHLWELKSLPTHHRDPFDRMIVSQARCERLTIATADAVMPKYPVQVLW